VRSSQQFRLATVGACETQARESCDVETADNLIVRRGVTKAKENNTVVGRVMVQDAHVFLYFTL
jgi:hypothetical protein